MFIVRMIKRLPGLFIAIWYFFTDLFYSYSVTKSQKGDLAELMVANHVLEKGITMPNRRLGFGYDRVRAIINRLNKYIPEYGSNYIEIQSTLKILEQYLHIHETQNFELPKDISTSIKNLLINKNLDTAICFESTPNNLFKPTNDFYEFAHSRHTCRWYSERSVDNDVLTKAIELAQTAPSACNRQSTKVYIVESKDKKTQVLELQNGNRGFGGNADKIILITADMSFWSYNRRTSAFLDAGIFTMNLLYALHYYKICACTLNAHLSISETKKLRAIINYQASEIPVAFISIGIAPEHMMIAGSQRIELNQILKIV